MRRDGTPGLRDSFVLPRARGFGPTGAIGGQSQIQVALTVFAPLINEHFYDRDETQFLFCFYELVYPYYIMNFLIIIPNDYLIKDVTADVEV